MTTAVSAVARPHRRIPGESGIWVMIAGDLLVFSLFFLTFAFEYRSTPEAFAAGQALLNRPLGLANTMLLLTSSLAVAMGVKAVGEADSSKARRRFAVGVACGAGFVIVKAFEWGAKFGAGIFVGSSEFFTFYFMFTGIHLLHVIAGLAALLWARALARQPENPRSARMIESSALFWHLVDLLWVFLFALLYLVKP